MSEHKASSGAPWTDPELMSELERSAELTDWPEESERALWRSIDSRLDRPARPRWRLAMWGAPALAALAASVLVFVPWLRERADPSAELVALGDEGSLRVRAGSVYRVERAASADRNVVLDRGAVEARIRPLPPGRILAVQTPHLRAVVVGTRFSVEVSPQSSEVVVTEGTVRVEVVGRPPQQVGAGQSVRVGAAQPAAAPDPSAAPLDAVAHCEQEGTVEARRACYRPFLSGTGLAAQNALYGLAALERDQGRTSDALALFEEHRRRFPAGLLAPEVSLEVLRLLVDERRFAKAVEEAEQFTRRFERDARGPEVRLLRANLLCAELGQREAARQAYLEGAAAARDGAREEALCAMARCAQLQGERAQAREDWRRYLDEFPRGAHAQEARDQLRSKEP